MKGSTTYWDSPILEVMRISIACILAVIHISLSGAMITFNTNGADQTIGMAREYAKFRTLLIQREIMAFSITIFDPSPTKLPVSGV